MPNLSQPIERRVHLQVCPLTLWLLLSSIACARISPPGLDGFMIFDAAADGAASSVDDAKRMADIGAHDVLESSAAECQKEAIDLPAPDSACTVEGSVRCTGAGSFSRSDATEPSGVRCIRPNRVICARSDAGLRWQLAACGPPPQSCNAFAGTNDSAATTMLCQENERGAACCPLEVGDIKSPQSVYWGARLCDAPSGETKCAEPFGMLHRCQFINEAEGGEWLKTIRGRYDNCAEATAQCRYWYTPSICPPVALNPCTGVDWEERGGWMDTVQACIDPPNEAARCAKNCQDLQKAGYPLPGK